MVHTLVLRSADRYSGTRSSYTILLPTPDILPQGVDFTLQLKQAFINSSVTEFYEIYTDLGGGRIYHYDTGFKGPSNFIGLHDAKAGLCEGPRITCQTAGVSLNMVSVLIKDLLTGAAAVLDEDSVLVFEIEIIS